MKIFSSKMKIFSSKCMISNIMLSMVWRIDTVSKEITKSLMCLVVSPLMIDYNRSSVTFASCD